ncbi:hypothetical protein QJS83_13685 [Bdellovibrio sp. 22V]|uniref:hypothetical protein n=1 Tax=Bdellovibrio TaxID=958 RepID=UPI002542FEA5|nr:hypothetical protein [Bdellovibrio sp. 22V]WII71515.1 hypothetical protein QJS83_13685 [Bdellovibrio sp. 22V]
MNTELGAFALRQILAGTAVMGPILILAGLSYYLFKQDRRSVIVYLTLGVAFSLIGGVCLYVEFKGEEVKAVETAGKLLGEPPPVSAATPAQK